MIASISHSNFKLGWVLDKYKDLSKKIFNNECNLMSTPTITKLDSEEDENDCMSDKEFYDHLYPHNLIHTLLNALVMKLLKLTQGSLI